MKGGGGGPERLVLQALAYLHGALGSRQPFFCAHAPHGGGREADVEVGERGALGPLSQDSLRRPVVLQGPRDIHGAVKYSEDTPQAEVHLSRPLVLA